MTNTSFITVTKSSDGIARSFDDRLAVEEPLEIRLEYQDNSTLTKKAQRSISITMRTPGEDADLALGFLFTEGLIESSDFVESVEHCGPKLAHLGHSNVLKVKISDPNFVNSNLKSLERNFYTTSSCGVCGKASIDALKTQNKFTREAIAESGPAVKNDVLVSLPDKLRSAQAVFDRTGGLHASGLFSSSGELIALREDVGRHNALDKLIGFALQNKELPLDNHILLLSGRISFELVQKASMSGIRFIAAVGAPSSLAVELAREMKMTLIGFLRGTTFNIYSGEWRLK